MRTSSFGRRCWIDNADARKWSLAGRLFTLSLAWLCAGSYIFSVTHTLCSGRMAEKCFVSRQNVREKDTIFLLAPDNSKVIISKAKSRDDLVLISDTNNKTFAKDGDWEAALTFLAPSLRKKSRAKGGLTLKFFAALNEV